MSRMSRMKPYDEAMIEKRVRRGAKMLDRLRPGWYQRVKLTSLKLHDGSCCVLGQEFAHEPRSEGVHHANGYEFALYDPNSVLPPKVRDDPGHWGFSGFSEQDCNDNYECRDGESYQILNRVWKRVIKERRAAARNKAAA